ncbi:MAG: ATP-binding protein, partial [Clostridiales bacterium]|nr:ATP-binding protein [Clostridiales bacterium]
SYFLSRPRRFGKSLLLDTISEVFSGDKELFKGLWIYDSDYDFPKHPVLRMDMSNIANETPEALKFSLSDELTERAREEGLDVAGGMPSDLYKKLIIGLYKKYNQGVVILIDEYDKPILDHLLDVEAAEANRAVIRSFYGVLKSLDPYIRLTFITGVSKFTKTSIFSELNNLLDVTMLEKYANICGIPVEELDKHFHEYIEALALKPYFKRFDNLHDEILAWYDGYSWDGQTRVINPFGLLSFFAQERFASFWYSSGSPKFLMDMIKRNPDAYAEVRDFIMGEWEMDNFDVGNIQAAPLLFQTGYLTVKEVVHGLGSTSYLLEIPNFEVRETFNLQLTAELTEQDYAVAGTAYRRILDALQKGDLRQMLTILKSLYAGIPYQLHIHQEAYYHSLFYAMMNLLGFDTSAEVATSMGRIDAVLEIADKVYVLEFKYEDCAPDADEETKRKLYEKALDEGVRQLADRGYADKYIGSGREIIQAAFAFLGRDNIEMRLA